jgi:site-specific DNA-methyltransferase (adenine-specific)
VSIIINGDFRDYLHLFDDGIIISDPPYNQNLRYSSYKDNLETKAYKSMLKLAFSNRKSVIIHYPEETINILSKVLENCQESVAWVYNSNTKKQHRQVTWWGCKPDFRKVGQDYKNPTDKLVAKLIADGKRARLYDWWNINQVKNKNKYHSHPCPIPLELAERIILTTTNIGDTVIDPFMGSGTICLAAKKHGRKYIGIEIDQEYFNIAKDILDC